MSDESTEHFTLPDGRVVRVFPASQPARPEHPGIEEPPPREDTPQVCPSCSGQLVYPVSWEERVGDTWKLNLRCPDCEWRGSGEFGQRVVEAFDDVLNDGTEAMLNALRSASRANMEADVERFITAMNGDEIEPMDF